VKGEVEMGRRKGFGAKQPKEKAEFKDAPEVAEVAARMIDDINTHLAEARIKFMFRTGKWEKRGRTIYGKAEKVGQKWKFLSDFDFLIVINRDGWFQNNMDVRKAVLDHELTHCARGEDDKMGNPKWYIQDHSVEDFPAVIKRHGLWTASLQRLVQAKTEYEQISLLPRTGTEG
jgi:hypothetical protein